MLRLFLPSRPAVSRGLVAAGFLGTYDGAFGCRTVKSAVRREVEQDHVSSVCGVDTARWVTKVQLVLFQTALGRDPGRRRHIEKGSLNLVMSHRHPTVAPTRNRMVTEVVGHMLPTSAHAHTRSSVVGRDRQPHAEKQRFLKGAKPGDDVIQA